MAQALKFQNVKKGDWLIDEWGQICKVVNKSKDAITTKRYENNTFWDNMAMWPKNFFDGRAWYRTKKRTNA